MHMAHRPNPFSRSSAIRNASDISIVSSVVYIE